MTEKTTKQMTLELYQAVVGIPENPDDNGLIGDIKEIKGTLLAQNNRIRNNERGISRIKGILYGVGVLGGGSGIGVGIYSLFG